MAEEDVSPQPEEEVDTGDEDIWDSAPEVEDEDDPKEETEAKTLKKKRKRRIPLTTTNRDISPLKKSFIKETKVVQETGKISTTLEYAH